MIDKFQVIIDVRSQREYAHSHIPNAINYPVLDDEEYKKIGTLYKKDSFSAKVRGASLVCKNISKHLIQLENIITPAKPFLIYCARGGMRSNSFFVVLKNIGYQVTRLEGGYKAYRKEVTNYLDTTPKHKFITLVGKTGSGKSEIIQNYKDSIDLENLAQHLGSSFGGICGIQPSIKQFQNMLHNRMIKLEQAPFVLIEGESKKLGEIIIPSKLYQSYQNSPKILITSPLEHRIQRIVKQYGVISREFFQTSMQKISPFMEKRFWLEAQEAYNKEDLEKVAEILLVKYYDKVYKKDDYQAKIEVQNIEDSIPKIQQIAKDLINIK